MRVVSLPLFFSLPPGYTSKEAVSKASLTSRGSITRPEAHEQEDSASVTKIKSATGRSAANRISDEQQEQSHLIVPPTDITVLLEVCL